MRFAAGVIRCGAFSGLRHRQTSTAIVASRMTAAMIAQVTARAPRSVASGCQALVAMRHLRFYTRSELHSRSVLLQRVQPALSGLMDGSLSTLAPIFAVVLATYRPLTVFYTGLATALGAGEHGLLGGPLRHRRI
jgi:hypothetical protein